MTSKFYAAAAFTAALFASSTAYAADCPIDIEDPFDVDAAGVEALYACIADTMLDGYTKEGDETAMAYRNWAPTATRPAVAGPHGNRFLQTFANDVAAEQYLKFAEEGVAMPAGSVLAKESFKIHKKKKKAVVGPLFLMTKVEAGGAPETNDWVYGGILPNGKPMKFKQAFCHDCHSAWEDQDYLAYPLEEVRLSSE